VLEAYAEMPALPAENTVPICDGVVTNDQMAQYAKKGVQEFRFWFMQNMYLNDADIITPKTDESTCNGMATATAPPSADAADSLTSISQGMISATGLFRATYMNWPFIATTQDTPYNWDSSKLWLLDNCKSRSNRGGNGCWYSSTYSMDANLAHLAPPQFRGKSWNRCCGDKNDGQLLVTMQELVMCSVRL